MWDFRASRTDSNRYLVLGFTSEPATGTAQPPRRDELIAYGPLLSDDGSTMLGLAALLEAPDSDSAREVIPADRYTGVEVHQWRFGGRPT
jgi:uncharacterized protein